MASTRRLGRFRRHPQRSQTFQISSPGRNGALVSSAARLDITDQRENKVQRMLRQNWQSEAWSYRDQIGELRYAIGFLANCTARMRLYPACYPPGGEADKPVELEKVTGLPPNIHGLCEQAIADLGNGRMAISGLLYGLSTNTSVAGESYLLGRIDPGDGRQRWTVRSIDEVIVEQDRWHLREVPGDRLSGEDQRQALDPDLDVISRIWTPHPRFQLLADSPLRAMLDDCESLTILRRMIRATGRSRLASRGLLLVPEELSIKAPVEDDSDPEADPFMSMLTQAMMAPIVSEGTADGVVPIVIRGPGDQLAKMRLLELSTSFDAESSKTREELIGIIATGFDLPKEVIMGVADLNHWSAWQVDDSVWRSHVEPHVIGVCDSLSGAYLRPYLSAAGVAEEWVDRLVLHYDPTELVTPPDLGKSAEAAFNNMAISAKAYRDNTGFSDEDAPSVAELEMRRVLDIRALPLNLLMEYARRFDPTLIVPPITQAGEVPGIKPGGVDVGVTPPDPGAPAAGVPVNPAPPAASTPAPAGPPPAARPAPSPVTAAAAASSSQARRLSRRLQSIDATLRARLQTAANAALMRQLERAGARLRTKVAKDETLRAKIAHRANERVPALLGREVVTAAGLSPSELVSGDWSALRSQFHEWTAAAQEQALTTALRIGQLDADSEAAVRARTAMAAGRDAAWDLLSSALTSLGQHLLYSPDPNAGPGDWAGLNPDTLVPAGTIRAALGVAGGADTHEFTVAHDGQVATPGYVGQVGTGATISDLLTTAGATQAQFEWVHGPALHPFEAHEDLDGVQFESFDDEALANPGDWPPVSQLLPGDHDGCLCDVMPLWDFPGNPMNDSSEGE